jgi:hypothetical protein
MSDLLVSSDTTLTIVVGIVIAVAYLVAMGRALVKAAATVDRPEPDGVDAFSYSFAGAILAVIASSLAIISYGWSPSFLYVGVVLALLSPIAVTYTLIRELRD